MIFCVTRSIPVLMWIALLWPVDYGEGGEAEGMTYMTHSLQVEEVVVPTYGISGNHAILSCFYSSTSSIYSVSWYKNGLEFYSYLPSLEDPIRIYPLEGIHVDVTRSNSESVHLQNLSLSTTGRYRCEVSSEAPVFATDSKYGDMLVIVVPTSPPTIHTTKYRYAPGEILSANCTSENSKPGANLTWYINQRPAGPESLINYQNINIPLGFDYIHTSRVGLRYKIKREDFENEHRLISIKCAASIFNVYYKTVENSIRRSRRRPNSEPPTDTKIFQLEDMNESTDNNDDQLDDADSTEDYGDDLFGLNKNRGFLSSGVYIRASSFSYLLLVLTFLYSKILF